MLNSSTNKESIKGLVSIIIPAYQAEAFIERSVYSAINQTYSNIEVIVVENGCTDRTLEILAGIQDERLRIEKSEKGVSNARNKGIMNCRGEFLTFLDADDWLEEDAVETMMSVVEDDTDVISARYFDDKPIESYYTRKYEAGSTDYVIKCLLTPTKRGNCTGNLYRAKFIVENGISFDPNLSHAEDTVFFTKALIHNPIVVDLERPIYHVYCNPGSATRSRQNDNTDEFCKAIKQIYIMLSNCSDSVRNAGYICALNQLLVILVNNQNGMKNQIQYIKAVVNRMEFSIAIREVDISQVKGAMKYIFILIIKKLYLPLAIAVSGRRTLNTLRRRKTMHD